MAKMAHQGDGTSRYPHGKGIPTRLSKLQPTSEDSYPEKEVALGKYYVLKPQDGTLKFKLKPVGRQAVSQSVSQCVCV
jgi:hypothetical protein